MVLNSVMAMANTEKDKEFLNGPDVLEFCEVGHKNINFQAQHLVKNDERILDIKNYSVRWKNECEKNMSAISSKTYLQKHMVWNIASFCLKDIIDHVYKSASNKNKIIQNQLECTREFHNKYFPPEVVKKCEEVSDKKSCLALIDKDSVYPPKKEAKKETLKREALKLPTHELKDLYEAIGDKLGVSDSVCQPGIVNGNLRDIKDVSDQTAPTSKPASSAAKQ